MQDEKNSSDIDRVELRAPAKVNLGLEILRRRPDGYHDLNTLFATVDLFDTLVISRKDSPGVGCRVRGDALLAAEPTGANLCVRGAELLLYEAGRTREGIAIDLVKNIPTGAGLGGGSSDAAATLRGVARLLGLHVGETRLHTIALSLGSDVPFFLQGGVALAGGQGEELEAIDIELPWTILLVNPGIHVPTAEAYRLVGREGERPATDLVARVRRGLTDPGSLGGALVNDFERPVFTHWPEIAELYGRLAATDGTVHTGMSGSGSTLFALYQEREAAERAAGYFAGYFTHVGRLGVT